MANLFDLAPPPPVEPPLAPVVQLHPDGVRVRTEVRDGIEFFWAERWRSNRSSAAVIYDRAELEQLRDAIDRVLR